MTTFVKSSCHCGLNVFTIAFTTSSLPISNDLCHCSSCRHSSGQLVLNHVTFLGVPLSPTNTTEPADLSNLKSYKTSDAATRWFCPQCSTHMLWEWTNRPEPSWCVTPGSLERTEGILSSTYHIFIEDTLDGGLADYLRVIDGVELPRYAGWVDPEKVLPIGWRATPAPFSEQGSSDRLPMYCHCRSVNFFLTRPTPASAIPSSPYPDALYAYHSNAKDFLDNPGDEKWWLRPKGADNPTHYLAGHCACTSCRRTSGFQIQSWAFVPRVNIVFPSSTGKPVELNLQDPQQRPAGLKHYKSSEGRNREFCGTCGATVFWWGEERPELVDVSVGLVDESIAGARAETWFEWTKERISFEEEAVDKVLVRGLAEGLQAS